MLFVALRYNLHSLYLADSFSTFLCHICSSSMSPMYTHSGHNQRPNCNAISMWFPLKLIKIQRAKPFYSNEVHVGTVVERSRAKVSTFSDISRFVINALIWILWLITASQQCFFLQPMVCLMFQEVNNAIAILLMICWFDLN